MFSGWNWVIHCLYLLLNICSLEGKISVSQTQEAYRTFLMGCLMCILAFCLGTCGVEAESKFY